MLLYKNQKNDNSYDYTIDYTMTQVEWRVNVYVDRSYKFGETRGQIFTIVKFKSNS